MKALSILCYIIGSGLLIASCFTTGIAVTWSLGGAAVLVLILGCIFQFNTNNQHHMRPQPQHVHHHSR